MTTALASLVVLGGGTTPTHAAAGPAIAATGQVDRAILVAGALRSDLLSASVPGRNGRNYPDPAHPIVIRATLPVTGNPTQARALLVTFRSLAGRRCTGVTFQRRGLPVSPPECLQPCRDVVCLAIYSGGPLPRGARILVGRAQARVDEIRVATPSGAVRRYRVSRSRVGVPPAAPILARVGPVRRVGAYANGQELASARFHG